MLALQFQLEQTQWWPPERLAQAQLAQLNQSLAQARATVAFYRDRLPAAPLDWDAFRALPRLTRSEVQAQGAALLSNRVPPQHGDVASGETSGSTGRPITYYATGMSQFFWRAFTLRDHLWHRRDLCGKLAVIRPRVETMTLPGWGPSAEAAFHTGPCLTLGIAIDVDEQLAWLAGQRPDYVLSMARNLHALAQRALERGVKLPGLREARAYGEVLPEDAREIVRRAWDVPLTDLYTAEEVGYIALQCPDGGGLHLQAENLVVEILDPAGRACGPGEIGKVVITTLHNFAMPLIRYELGDYAEAGAACRCGRGLPVVTRVLGRSRNLMTLPGGAKRWPSFASERWSHLAPVRQLQLVQRSVEEVAVRVVAARPLSPPEKAALVRALQQSLRHPFRMPVEEVAEISRSGHKYEDFVSEMGA